MFEQRQPVSTSSTVFTFSLLFHPELQHSCQVVVKATSTTWGVLIVVLHIWHCILVERCVLDVSCFDSALLVRSFSLCTNTNFIWTVLSFVDLYHKNSAADSSECAAALLLLFVLINNTTSVILSLRELSASQCFGSKVASHAFPAFALILINSLRKAINCLPEKHCCSAADILGVKATRSAYTSLELSMYLR